MKHKQKSRNKRPRKEDSDSDDDDMKRNAKPVKSAKKEPTSGVQFSKLQTRKASPPAAWSSTFVKNLWGKGLCDHISDDLKSLRKGLGILVKGAALMCPPPITSLQDSDVPSSFLAILGRLNISQPSAIQMQSWPAILAGCNVLGIAPTGSGKTLAFCLPMIPHLQHQMPSLKRPTVASPTCLVVVPTRELAIQVAAVVKKFRSSTGITSIAIYGGSDRDQQLETLSDCPHMHVVVATPGRLIDLVATNSLSLDRVTYLVIDEADRMLALGFEEQLTVIGSYIRPDRQALLFTATFPGKLRDVSARWMGGSADGMVGSNDDSNTVIIRVNTVEFRPTGEGSDQPKRDNVKAAGAVGDAPCTDGEQRKNSSPRDTQLDETLCTSSGASTTTASGNTSTSLSLTISRSIEQKVHVCAAHKKPRLLINYVTKIREQEKAAKLRQGGPMIIFCTKIKTVAFVTNFLLKNGVVGVQQLHGQLPQQRREGVLADFKAGKVLTVCATDVAARGIHIKRLKYVVNYDFPGSLEQYCHRVGRTGRREGDQGFSYSLLTRNLAPLAEDLMSLLRSCGQLVEPNLERLVSDYQNGLIDVSAEEEAAEDDGVQADTAAQGGGGDGDCSDDDCSDDGGVE